MGVGNLGSSTQTASTGLTGPPPYSEQIQAGIAKLAQHDPLGAQGMAAAHASNQPYSSSFLGGLWNGLFNGAKSFGGGVVEGLGNIASAFSEPFRDEEEGSEENFVVDFFEGLGGKENNTWSRNLASYVEEETPVVGDVVPQEGGFMREAIGLTLDIFADPTTYIGAGGLGLAREAIARGAKDIGEHGVKAILSKEAAEAGGLRIKDKFIRYEDQFVPAIYQEGRALLKATGVGDDALDAMAGQLAHNADQKALGIVDEAINKETHELGVLFGDTILRKRNLQALPETYTSKTLGRKYKREELQKIFLGTQKLSRQQQIDLANRVFGGKANLVQRERLGRTAAAAMGGLRLKFGIPFGEQMAKTFGNDFFAHRWQTNALSTRWKLGNKEFGVTDMGNFFRGTSGLVKLDAVVQQSIANGDKIWDRGAMEAFLRAEEGGFAGLKNYMYDKGLDGQKEWDRVFGRGVTSIATPWSERAGKLTEGLTPGARAWRRDGYYGMQAYQTKRTAQVREKQFRQFANKFIEPWARASRHLGEDAATKGQDWARGVYRDVIHYAEYGDDASLAKLPDYMQKVAKEIRPTFRKLHTTASKHYGVKLGDLEEVFARNHHETALKAVRKRSKELDEEIRKIDFAGADEVEGAKMAEELEQLTMQKMKLDGEANDLFAQLNNMDAYDEITELLDPKMVSKAGPKNYFHHRWSDKFRTEVIGNLQAETKSFNKAKSKAAELERKLKTMDFDEAEKYFKEKFPHAAEAAGGRVLEDNVLRVMTRYVEDLSSAVLKTELERGGKFILNQLGAIDTGAATRLTRNIVDPEWMPKAYRAMQEGRLGAPAGVKARIDDWLGDFEEKMGLVAVAQPARKTEPWHFTKDEWLKESTNRLGVEYAPDFDLTLSTGKHAAKGKPGIARTSQRAFESFALYDDAGNAVSALGVFKHGDLTDISISTKESERGKGYATKLLQHAKKELGIDEEEAARLLKSIGKTEQGDTLAHRFAITGAIKAGEKVPTKVLRDYPDIMENLVKVPDNLKEPEMRKLQTLFKELNQIRAQADGAVAIPEVAFKEVPNPSALGKWGRLDVPGLENFAMHPFMAAEFNKAWSGSVGKKMGGFRQGWRKFVMGPWKEWATLYWPGFHARNLMGAWFNNALAGVQPYHYSEMRKVMSVLKDGDKAVDKAGNKLKNMPYGPAKRMSVDGEVQDMTYGRVAEMLQDMGITGGNNWAMGDLRSYLASREYLSLEAGHSISHKAKFTGKFQTDRWGEVTGAEALARGWKELGMAGTTGVENMMRGAVFLKELESTGDTIAARASTMMRHGDYDELTDAENFIKDVLPFYKWMRTNLPFQMRQLIESPGGQLATLDLSNALVGEDERANMPHWMRESLLVHLPWTKKIDGVKGTEEVASFLMMELPLHDVFMTGNEFASGFLPIVRQLVIENGLMRKSMFTGAPLEGARTERMGYWSKVPGISHMIEATGIGERDSEGHLVTTDRWMNVLSTLPIYARFRNVLTDDPDREKLRVGAMVSMMAGMGVRSLGDEELNNVEADFFYSYVEPQIRKMQDMGYQFATMQDWGETTSSGIGNLGG